jgi:hypothetical protein
MCVSLFSPTVFDPIQEFTRNYGVFTFFSAVFETEFGNLAVLLRPLGSNYGVKLDGRNLNKWP